MFWNYSQPQNSKGLPQPKEPRIDENQIPDYMKSTNFVIQKYVEKPQLIQSRKFDIRLWVLVNQEGRVFMFKEAYVRTSSSVYSLDSESISDVNVHLTNNAVQKN